MAPLSGTGSGGNISPFPAQRFLREATWQRSRQHNTDSNAKHIVKKFLLDINAHYKRKAKIGWRKFLQRRQAQREENIPKALTGHSARTPSRTAPQQVRARLLVNAIGQE